MDFDWKKTLGVVAPTIASAIGTPVAGAAVAALCGIFGLSDGASEADLAKALQNPTPEQLIECKKAELGFKTRMAELDVKLFQTQVADTVSARNMAIKTNSIIIQVVILVVLSLLFSGCLWAMFHGSMEGLSETTKTILNMAIGSVGTMLGQVVNFFVGTNAGSNQKDKLLYNSTPNSARGE